MIYIIMIDLMCPRLIWISCNLILLALTVIQVFQMSFILHLQLFDLRLTRLILDNTKVVFVTRSAAAALSKLWIESA